MNGLRKFGGRTDAKRSLPGGYAGADERALARDMRSLALQLSPGRRVALKGSRALVEAVQGAREESARLRRESGSATSALERLCEDVRIMEACAEQARLEGGLRLPGSDGEARVLHIMRRLCAGGDVQVTRERLERALFAFDDVQALTMAELWAAPAALRIALLEGFDRTAIAILAAARERIDAERWVDGRGRGVRLSSRGAAFFERALQLTAERELPQLRKLLEDALLRGDQTPERCIQAAHEGQALHQMRLDNLVAAKRMLDALDSQACFARLSRVEAELRGDPAKVYPAMDDPSRDAVRAEVARLARRLKLGEAMVARSAVQAAKEACARYGEEDARATVCWWLYEDEGQSALLKKLGLSTHRLPRRVPDPKGRGYIATMAVLTSVLLFLFVSACGSAVCALWGLPLSWYAAGMLLGRVVPAAVGPRRLLKLKVERAGARFRTLVVIPALLSSPGRAREMCAQLETLGCLEGDPDVDFLLLGDFRDGENRREQDDCEITALASGEIARLNGNAGREKYFYLQRERVFYARDNRWMGRERKRGALMALNRVLLGEPGAESDFAAEGEACRTLAARRYAFVVTLDADTSMLPGTVHRLIGALAHPLNRLHEIDGVRRGYAVLQPNMELRASACVNRFVRVFAGKGGMDSYPVSVSNLHQDLTGRGIFGGKGIYDLAAFHRALDGALPDGRILSHDLLEGLIARAGFVGDVSLYDGFPTTISGYLKRLERWTRGDWQLLPFLVSNRAFTAPRKIDALDRIKLLDNLLRSLAMPALLALFVHSVWAGLSGAFAMGVILAFWAPLVSLPHVDGEDWRRAAAALTVLPSLAVAQAGAAARALWRLFVSHKCLLEWVTAADAEGMRRGKPHIAARVTVILLLPGLLDAAWALPAVALGMLFLTGLGWMRDLAETPTEPREALDSRQIGALTELARETWGFFERCVTDAESGLPPDNVQIDPPLGAARRTSPTNIGLYLLACLSAEKLGFIRRGEMLRRMEATVGTLEALEKWHGQLYNWYDIDALRPLQPRYVSAVDSGNLAACLLLAAQALAGETALAGRMRALAQGMDFAPLYDAERKLCCIGVDVDRERTSASHYDLLASESRILSYVAMMLGQAPVEHWKKLSRPAVRTEKGQALVSWSGTMFEYLMPEIFMRAPAGTLLHASNRAVVAVQRAIGAQAQRPWGVSESGYYAFDMHLNYQYRAFGVKQLALSGVSAQDVVAPYASVLALPVAPAQAAENILRMRGSGWAGELGLYEAADYAQADGAPRLVGSYMAHHQGMILCALCNALADDALVKCFASIPEARALSLLLEEKPYARLRLPRQSRAAAQGEQRRPVEERCGRPGRPADRLVDAHMLSGAGATAQLTARGDMYYARNGVMANCFGGDFLRRREGIFLHMRIGEGGRDRVFGEAGTSVVFDAGTASYTLREREVEARMEVCISPEDGALLRRVEIKNNAESRISVLLTDCFAVALAAEADMRAHPAFQKLFVHSERVGRALRFTRRSRAPEESHPALLHLASGGELAGWETDLCALVGRSGDLAAPEGIAESLAGALGDVLNPCSALRVRLEVDPGEVKAMHFAVGLVEPHEMQPWLQKNAQASAPERAGRLAATQARAMLGFLGLKPDMHNLLQRASAFLTDAHLRARPAFVPAPEAAPAGALWPLGISGDMPILCATVADMEQLSNARELIRMHEFYRIMGLWTDLVLINDYGNDYDQPLREAMRDLIAASHLRDMMGMSGGVWLLEGSRLEPARREMLLRGAALSFDGSGDVYAQLRESLRTLDAPRAAACAPMESGLLEDAHRPENGFGEFSGDGSQYVMRIGPGHETPTPWVNILAGETFGALVTERGGGFLWRENSRNGRITPFDNDALDEGWGWMFYLADESRRECVRLLPGKAPSTPFAVTHGAGYSRFESALEGLEFSTTLYVAGEEALCAEI